MSLHEHQAGTSCIIKQHNLNLWEVAKNRQSPGQPGSGGWDRICRKMKRCCQGELGVQGTPALSGERGYSLTSVSANKQLRLIGDAVQAAIPARMVPASVLAMLRMEEHLWLCCFALFYSSTASKTIEKHHNIKLSSSVSC